MAPVPLPPPARPAVLDITVETLTGAGFRLRVSSYETAMSVKAKIQRIEGLPISQQHLIFKDRELPDSSPLAECGVSDGSKLKLVVAMRGGPVNTRRLPIYDDFTLAEMQQFMDMHREAPWERDSTGRQVTLLVFREGDQVNFYRVMENTDGTFSPLSDSFGSTIRNMFHEENPEEVRRKIEENTNTMSKMSDLKQKMQQMSLKKKGRGGKTSSRLTSRQASVQDRFHLPPVPSARQTDQSEPRPRATTQSTPSRPHNTFHSDLSESFSRVANQSASTRPRRGLPANLSEAFPRAANQSASLMRVTSAASELAEERQLLSRGQLTSGRRRKLSLSESAELFKQMQAQRGLEWRNGGRTSVRDYAAYRRTLTKVARHPGPHAPPPSDPAGSGQAVGGATAAAGDTGSELPVVLEGDERRGALQTHQGFAASGRAGHRFSMSAGVRPRTSPMAPGYHHYAKDDAERAVSPSVSLLPTDGRARQLCRILSAGARTGQPPPPPPTAPPALGTTQPPPPPRKPARPKRPRCLHCRKRLGITGAYTCHCTGTFCAEHRYPEAHECTYDFKTEGRKLLERANPLVTAPKLPKI